MPFRKILKNKYYYEIHSGWILNGNLLAYYILYIVCALRSYLAITYKKVIFRSHSYIVASYLLANRNLHTTNYLPS